MNVPNKNRRQPIWGNHPPRLQIEQLATHGVKEGRLITKRYMGQISTPVQNCPASNPACFPIDVESLPGIKRPGRGVDQPPHIAPRINKEYSYTSSPPLCLHGRLYGELLTKRTERRP
jgi:hypothetical protein